MKLFKTITLTVATTILAVVLSLQSASADPVSDHCEDVANVTMALTELRDNGIRADVVYQYLISTGNWTTEQARVVLYGIYVLKKDVSPSDLGAEAYVVCMANHA